MIDVRDGRRDELERAVWLDFWLKTLSNMFGQCEHNLDKRAISREKVPGLTWSWSSD